MQIELEWQTKLRTRAIDPIVIDVVAEISRFVVLNVGQCF